MLKFLFIKVKHLFWTGLIQKSFLALILFSKIKLVAFMKGFLVCTKKFSTKIRILLTAL